MIMNKYDLNKRLRELEANIFSEKMQKTYLLTTVYIFRFS